MVPLLKAPMSTPDKARDDRVASFEGGVSLASMVMVAEPTDCPPWDAVTVTVSPPSRMTSSVAVTVAVAEPAPALRVSSVADRR